MRRTPPPAALAGWLCLLGLVLVLALGPQGCASTADDPPDLGKATVKVAHAMKSGAGAVGRGMGTAYRGVRSGFAAPDGEAEFGPYPADYVTALKRYFVLALRYPQDTSFRFGRPERGYLNQGLFRGGGIAWQGWLVDVQVETRQRLTGHRASRSYIARMRDGEVVDVHADGALLRRVEPRDPLPAPAEQAASGG